MNHPLDQADVMTAPAQPGDLSSPFGALQGLQGPIQGTVRAPVAASRVMSERSFPAGTPVEVEAVRGGWPRDAGLALTHEGVLYTRRLTAEDCEYPEDFTTQHNKQTVLSQDTTMRVEDPELTQRFLDCGETVDVYRQAGGKYWAYSQDRGWSAWFEDNTVMARAIAGVDIKAFKGLPEQSVEGAPVPLVPAANVPTSTPSKRLTF